MNKKLLIYMISIFSSGFGYIEDLCADHVRGYYKKNGTYVQPHERTHADRYKYNNYSAKGNINPYTGKRGYNRHEYTNHPEYNKSYRYKY